jgi:RNA polymerase sigma factor (sigma-70 family)
MHTSENWVFCLSFKLGNVPCHLMNLWATYQGDANESFSTLSDQSSLLDRLKHREPEAQEQIFKAENRRLQALAMTFLGSTGDVGPLVADVFTDFFYSYVDRVEHERAISAYLRIMIVRRARRLAQRRSQEHDIFAYDLADMDGHDVIEALDVKAWLPWLEDCSALLPEKAHKILKLRFGHELDLNEIGAQLGITKQAVSKTIQKCIAQLRRCLEARRSRIAARKGRE